MARLNARSLLYLTCLDLRSHLSLLHTVNADLPDYEKLQMVVVANNAWSVENGCLTPTMKIKRSRIEADVASQVDGWFATPHKVQWA